MTFEPQTYQATTSIGACMAGLAVKDSLAIMHGGAGCDIKIHNLLHRHDPSGQVHERLICTKVREHDLVLDPGELLLDATRDLVARVHPQLVVVSSATFVEVAGLDRTSIVAELREKLQVPIVYVYAPDTSGDLFDGYSRGLAAITERIAETVGRSATRKGRLNLVGYVHDRPWREHEANIDEARRLLRALDLELNLVLLDGPPTGALSKLADAELAVAIPGGEEAGRVLQEKLGQKLIEVPVPIGTRATADWLRKIGEAMGVSARKIDDLIKAEASNVQATLRRAAEPIMGSRVAVFSETAKLESLIGLCRDLSLIPVMAGALDERAERLENLRESVEHLLIAPGHPTTQRHLAKLMESTALDLVIGTADQADIARRLGLPALEVGFPCRAYQALYPVPLWGYQGVLASGSRIIEAITARRFT